MRSLSERSKQVHIEAQGSPRPRAPTPGSPDKAHLASGKNLGKTRTFLVCFPFNENSKIVG